MGEPNFCHVFCALYFELCFGITCFCSHTHCVCFDTMCVVFIVVFGSCAFIYIIIIIIISIIIMTSFSLFAASCAHYYSPLLSCHLSIMSPFPPPCRLCSAFKTKWLQRSFAVDCGDFYVIFRNGFTFHIATLYTTGLIDETLPRKIQTEIEEHKVRLKKKQFGKK